MRTLSGHKRQKEWTDIIETVGHGRMAKGILVSMFKTWSSGFYFLPFLWLWFGKGTQTRKRAKDKEDDLGIEAEMEKEEKLTMMMAMHRSSV